MNLAMVSIGYMRERPLVTGLNLLLLALGVATITVMLLVTTQIEERLQRDVRGIDLVVGAKGSPMQLILSAVFHLDTPTGNISLSAAHEVARHPMVRQAIPIALGDSYRGFRIVGTNRDYPALYGARAATGRLWEKPLEAVIGAEVAQATGLAVGSQFTGAHGLEGGGDSHESSPYVVVGVLAPGAGLLDRLVLTSVESVWAVHQHGEPGDDPQKLIDAMDDEEKELTALLLRYASPLAAVSLPRFVNATPALQAASPAFESARLFRMMGVGVEVVHAFGLVLVFASVLSVFIALWNALEDRRYDLAVMRMLGASPARLLSLMLVEALLLALAGAAAGLALGHALTAVVGEVLRETRQMGVSGAVFLVDELWLLALVLGTGVLAASLPAWRAARVDVAAALAEG
jgi:putative ABC transport system permease protein